MKLIKKLFAKILEHYLMTILVIVLPASTILELCTKYKPVTNYAVPFFQWYWTPWIILMGLFIWITIKHLTKKIRKEKRDKKVKPPKYFASSDQGFVDREYANVIWKVMIGSDAGASMSNTIGEHNVRVWIKRDPYCPECNFELERIGRKWHCIPCSKNYAIPTNLKNDTWVKMTKIFQRYSKRLAERNWMVDEKPQVPFHKYLKDRKRLENIAQHGISDSRVK